MILFLTLRFWWMGFSLPNFQLEDNPAAFHPRIFTRYVNATHEHNIENTFHILFTIQFLTVNLYWISVCSFRLLSNLHIYTLNTCLLLCPTTLSHDWQMGSVKLVTSFNDVRNIQSAALVVAMLSLVRGCFHKVSFTSDEKDIELIKNIDNPRLCQFLYTILPFFFRITDVFLQLAYLFSCCHLFHLRIYFSLLALLLLSEFCTSQGMKHHLFLFNILQ